MATWYDQTPEDKFIPHGSYTVSNAIGYEVELHDSGDCARLRYRLFNDEYRITDWLDIVYMPNEDTPEEWQPVIDPDGLEVPLNLVMRNPFIITV